MFIIGAYIYFLSHFTLPPGISPLTSTLSFSLFDLSLPLPFSMTKNTLLLYFLSTMFCTYFPNPRLNHLALILQHPCFSLRYNIPPSRICSHIFEGSQPNLACMVTNHSLFQKIPQDIPVTWRSRIFEFLFNSALGRHSLLRPMHIGIVWIYGNRGNLLIV